MCSIIHIHAVCGGPLITREILNTMPYLAITWGTESTRYVLMILSVTGLWLLVTDVHCSYCYKNHHSQHFRTTWTTDLSGRSNIFRSSQWSYILTLPKTEELSPQDFLGEEIEGERGRAHAGETPAQNSSVIMPKRFGWDLRWVEIRFNVALLA